MEQSWNLFISALQAKNLVFADVATCDLTTRLDLLNSIPELSAFDRAVISAAWGKAAANLPQSNTVSEPISGIAHYLATAEERAREPWRAALSAHKAAVKALFERREAALTELKQLAMDLAKAAALSPMEVLTTSYVLFGGPDDLLFFSNCLLRLPMIERIQAHNWWVAERLGDVFINANGAKIQTLQFPLFPPDPGFSSLNTLVLSGALGGTSASTSHMLPAGGSTGRISPHKKSTVELYRPEVSGGQYLVGVQQSDQGPYVDLSPIEESFMRLQQNMQEITKQFETVHTFQRGRGRGSLPPHRGRGRGSQYKATDREQAPPAYQPRGSGTPTNGDASLRAPQAPTPKN